MKALLYYQYTKIEDPQKFRDEHFELCKKLELKGRILIADEGINGTVCGTEENIAEYKKVVNSLPGFENMEWKEDDEEKQIFPRLRVVVRAEIVTLGLRTNGKDVNIENRADYIEPEDLLNMYENNEEFYVVDGRNEYEGRIGKFKNALVPNIKNFRELPEYIKTDPEFQKLKDKPVVTYCTGGIRCEKFSALLKENGFKNVRQLHGGVHKYAKQTGGKYFDGELYVFDGRVHVKVNEVNPEVISECKHCGIKISRYTNCANTQCNEQHIACVDCQEKFRGACSEECMNLIDQNKELVRKQSKDECGCI